MSSISIGKCIVDTGVVNDVKCSRQSVITYDFMTSRYPLNNSDVIMINIFICSFENVRMT